MISHKMKEIEEIVIKKISAYRTSLENMHLLETVHSYIENNKDKFIDRTYNCNVRTSQKVVKNILYDVAEFSYLTTNLENMIKGFLHQTLGKHAPFIIFESWINIYGKNGYQEPHIHVPPGDGGAIGVGCLYLTENNSEIQFIVYPEVTTKNIIPKKGDVVFFDGTTFHRVIDSEDERISLAFNFKVLP